MADYVTSSTRIVIIHLLWQTFRKHLLFHISFKFLLVFYIYIFYRLCGLVDRVLGYRSGGPGSIPGTTRFSEGNKNEKVVGLERGPLSLVSTTEELLDRKVAAPV
jgi:hypothetical protein